MGLNCKSNHNSHIDGDRYYKTGFPGHNLQRAWAQLKLLESMEEQFMEMEEVIRKFN